MKAAIENGVLRIGGNAILEGLAPAFSLRGGVLRLPLEADVSKAGPWRQYAIGNLSGVDAWFGQLQSSPFWFVPTQGRGAPSFAGAAVFIVARRADGLFVILVPLPSRNASSFLVSSGQDGTLSLFRSTGNASVAPEGGAVLLVDAARNLPELLERASRAVSRLLPNARLRADKKAPAFQDYLGWCTWNAFYHKVSKSNLLAGLESQRAEGVRPGFVIIDDGWQRQTEPSPECCRRLAAFGADEAKFPGGLAPAVLAMKRDFGVGQVFAWLTPQGLPAGIDKKEFARYRPLRSIAQADRHVDIMPILAWFDAHELVFPSDWDSFLRDRFAELRAAGIDGVKADFQGTLFFCSGGSPRSSRVAECRKMRAALGSRATEFFGSEWLSCMAHLQEFWYDALENNLSRGSDDFFPDIPSSHGSHIRANAFSGIWFGRFMGVDWDMFVSKHPFGAYHAAARAVSGGPIYTADAPAGTDGSVLRRLSFPDGRVPRFPDPAIPATCSLFPKEGDDPRAFVVANGNRFGGTAALFDLETASPQANVSARLSPSEIPNAEMSGECVVWREGGVCVEKISSNVEVALQTGSQRFTLATIVPVLDKRFAAVGLVDKFAPVAAVRDVRLDGTQAHIALAGGGKFVAWCASKPERIYANETELPFEWDAASGTVKTEIPDGEAPLVRVVF